MTKSSSERGVDGSGLGGLSWSYVDDRDRSGAENMAMDHALAAGLEPGQAVLRFYGWSEPTVSFGRNERTRVVDRTGAPFAFVRRPTGGRAVLHRDELTYAVVFPAGRGLRRAYLRVHDALAEGLRELGVDTTLADGTALEGPTVAGACFAQPAGGEVLVAGRKLLGSAQARVGGAILQHGSLLCQEDQSGLVVLGLDRPRAPPAVTLAEILDEVPGSDVLRAALRRGLERSLGIDLVAADPAKFELAARVHMPRYSSEAWTWRA